MPILTSNFIIKNAVSNEKRIQFTFLDIVQEEQFKLNPRRLLNINFLMMMSRYERYSVKYQNLGYCFVKCTDFDNLMGTDQITIHTDP